MAITPDRDPEKDPQDWQTGDEPMTGPQASYLSTLCQEAGEPFDDRLTKAQASPPDRGPAGEDRPRRVQHPRAGHALAPRGISRRLALSPPRHLRRPTPAGLGYRWAALTNTDGRHGVHPA
jgi:hypothetical protein